ncbi:unnamed protein product [Trichogramma brassicae]|uniref:Uncharacterized protein n=1 Tax=Trichogramma brassicae TaxID=86971 RepID=A0A6H5ICZ2_9HYME|nr:unnamed protein product [Trichogramma brassicae]
MVRDRVRSRPRKGAVKLQPTASAERAPAAQVCASAPIVQGELPSVLSTSTTEVTPAAVASVSQDKIQQKEIAAVPSTSSADVIIVAVKKAPISNNPCATGPVPLINGKKPNTGISFCEWKLRRISLPRLTKRVPNLAAPGPGVDPRGSPKPSKHRTPEPTMTYIPTPKAELARRRKEAAAHARALLRPAAEPEDIFADGGPISDADYEAWKARPFNVSPLRQVLL